MAHLLNIVKQQQQAPIDEEKLRILCHQHNIWDHFGVAREEFSAFSEVKQMQLLRKFYFDLVLTLSTSAMNASSSHIDSSIGSAIKNSSSLTMTKVIEMELTGQSLLLLPLKTRRVLKRVSTYGPILDILGLSPAFFPWRRQIYQKTPFFMSTKAINHAKMEKRSITQTFLSLHKSCCSPTNQQTLSITCSKRTRSRF